MFRTGQAQKLWTLFRAHAQRNTRNETLVAQMAQPNSGERDIFRFRSRHSPFLFFNF
jgi:hypothetical protein